MISSVGMMKFPTEWKKQIHVPNHQPDYINPMKNHQLFLYFFCRKSHSHLAGASFRSGLLRYFGGGID
jgi:hypothetical protein